jgi:Glycosyl hydrolase-like 10
MHTFLRTTCVIPGLLFLSLLSVPAEDAKVVVLTATDLAPRTVRTEEPTAGKWWLKRDVEGVPEKALLLTGKVNEGPLPKENLTEWGVVPPDYYTTPMRVPALEIDPKLKGWYRIQVGLVHLARHDNGYAVPFHPRLWGRLSDEPYPEYLQTPQNAQGQVVLVDWRSADLTGKTLRLEQPPAPMMHPGRGWYGGVSHIVFTPLSDAERKAAQAEETLPPVKHRLFGLLDTTDELFWYGTAEKADDVKGMIYRHEKAGFGRVYMRCWGSTMDNSHGVPDANPRWTPADDEAFRKANKCAAGWKAYIDMPEHFDPLKVAVDYGKERGVEVHAWVRMTNLNRPPYAEFWHKHPEYQALVASRDAKSGEIKTSRYSRVLSFAHPEVRAFYVKICKELASTGTKGILLDLLRHPPLGGFEKPTLDAYKAKYGEDLLARVQAGRDSRELLIHDPKVVDVFADFLEQFLRDLRKEVGPDLEIGVRSSGPDKYGLRGKKWIEDGLIQTIIDAHWYSGKGPRPTIAATVAAAGTRGNAFAAADPGNVDPKTWSNLAGTLSPEAILALARYYKSQGMHRFGLYESTEFCWRPECRRAIREAGRLFAAEK